MVRTTSRRAFQCNEPSCAVFIVAMVAVTATATAGDPGAGSCVRGATCTPSYLRSSRIDSNSALLAFGELAGPASRLARQARGRLAAKHRVQASPCSTSHKGFRRNSREVLSCFRSSQILFLRVVCSREVNENHAWIQHRFCEVKSDNNFSQPFNTSKPTLPLLIFV